MNTTTTIIFIIAAFALGVVAILQRNNIPAPLRRWVAVSAIFFIAFAFFLIVYSFTTMGT
ncbi:hypothetical protein K0T92_19975 [Paenibacillus oenotherae]|uniref:Signal transduction histidine kinase n=1 Tax=Paenibacillus oenotherae TaxID=1435645 RepID=A0ABS7DB71_9BACL|nr:hypothetical protein [Paenibacillus oenotherae]MBW7476998.1 hypothetical protein [Paenibacillus oenotherae]